MICKVKNTIEKYEMLSGVESVAVGLSGGADSMCLADILIRLKDDYGFTVKAVHINHNIRGDEAKRDALHVKKFCDEKGIELLLFEIDVPELSKKLGISEEECGRKVRYDCFAKSGCDAVATAHSLTDSVETVVFNLARGTGSKGLCGIPAKREPNIIRPLIDCSRDEIEEYCRLNGIVYVTDSTNLTDDYKRNHIRHNIIPALELINKSVDRAISKSAEILREENDFIDECARKLISDAATVNGLCTECFLSVHPAVRKRALRILLGNEMQKSVEQRHIALCDECIAKKNGKVELSEGLYFVVDDDAIRIFYEVKNSEPWKSCVKNNCFSTPYCEYKLVFGANNDGIDFDKIKNTLVATSRKDSDRIYLKKRKLTKSLKKIFNENKIPSTSRNEIAVLRDGENIVWVEGIGTDGNYLADEKSINVFYVVKDVQSDAQ